MSARLKTVQTTRKTPVEPQAYTAIVGNRRYVEKQPVRTGDDFFHTPRNSTEGQPVRRKADAPIRTFTRDI